MGPWLARWGLGSYAASLAELGYDLSVLAALTDEEAREMHAAACPLPSKGQLRFTVPQDSCAPSCGAAGGVMIVA